jgi:hypothetical protein
MAGWRLGLAGLAGLLACASCADHQPLRFVSGSLQVTPRVLDFAEVALHQQKSLELTLENVGMSALTLRSLSLDSTDDYVLALPAQMGGLAQGEQRKVTVVFAPRAEGESPARLAVASNAIDGARQDFVSLTGTGVDVEATLGTHALNFGRIEAQSQRMLTLALKNSSPLPVRVSSASIGKDADEFHMAPVELAPGESTVAQVTFAPVRVGVKDAALQVYPCEGCQAKTVALTAEGLDKAVVAVPWTVDFGQVPTDIETQKPLTLQNISSLPATITEMAMGLHVDPSFLAPKLPPFPVVLEPNATLTVPYTFLVSHMNLATGAVEVSLKSVRNPVETVQLRGFGGAPVLCLTPKSPDFGNVPLGAKATIQLNVQNCGSSNASPILVSSATLTSGDPAQFSVTPLSAPVTLAASQSVNVPVTYQPNQGGAATAAVTLQLDINGATSAVVNLKGTGETYPACNLVVTPGAVDFGTVWPGRGAVLGVKVSNPSSTLCVLKDVSFANDDNGAFFLPGATPSSIIMYPNTYFVFEVAFLSPQTPGPAQGLLQIDPYVGTPTQVPLTANSASTCLVASPWYLDFGVDTKTCAPPAKKVTLTNECQGPTTITSLAIGPGTSPGQFLLDNPPATPLTLNPGDTRQVTVDYTATITGLNLSPLYVGVQGLSDPLLVSLVGESSSQSSATDSFIQQAVNESDILLVVDNSLSMGSEDLRLQAALPALISGLQQANVSFHLAVTTTGITPAPDGGCPGGAEGGEAGRFFPVDASSPRIITSQTLNPLSALQKSSSVGTCQNVAEGFEPMRLALSSPLIDHPDDPLLPSQPNAEGNQGFLRPEAGLQVVFVTDHDDHSPDLVTDYVQFAQGLKGAQRTGRVLIHAIAPTQDVCPTAPGTGVRYSEAVQATGGSFAWICDQDYSPVFEAVASHVFMPQTSFVLSHTPQAGSITVTVNGQPVSSGWSYDSTSNAVVFGSAPPGGATINVTYNFSCS